MTSNDVYQPSGADDLFSCNACAVTIVSPTERLQHYKTEWHRYNVKRRCAGLGPISKDLFESQLSDLKRQKAGANGSGIRCEACNKSFSSQSAYEAHQGTKLHQKKISKKQDSMSDEKESSEQPEEETSTPAPKSSSSGMDVSDSKAQSDNKENDEENMEDEEDDETDPIPLLTCIFCNKQSSTFEQSLEHMRLSHSFYVPFKEHCCDLEGLIEYIGVKVGVGRICLYCNGRGRARFPSVRSCQQHMIDKSHCKLRFEDEDEEEEFAEFYNFPDVDGEELSDDEKEERESLSSSKSTSSTSLVAVDQKNELVTSDHFQPKRKVVAMNQLGELIMTDGTTIGHRSISYVYKQKLRPVRDSNDQALVVSHSAHPPPLPVHEKIHRTQRYLDKLNRYNFKVSLAKNNQKHHRAQVMV